MRLPKPYKNEALETYGRRIARESMPPGSKKIKYSKNLIWQIRGRSGNTIVLDLKGPCKGPIQEVMDIGVKEAQNALIRSKQIEVLWCKSSNPTHTAIMIVEQNPKVAKIHRQSAGRILKRLNELPREYKIRNLLIQLKSARKQQENEMYEEDILEARLWELQVLKTLINLHAGKNGEIIDQVARGAIAA